ncbi:MAG: O-antigen polymerase family protein [Planctomycetota bacterium]|nr:O-antigen polymerase family protein [Planctomycetota bacterium]
MNFLWLAWLPLLFLPNLGVGGPTGFGTLELSDFLIGPFLALTALAGRRRPRLMIQGLNLPLIGFVVWASFATVLIRERYGYPDHLAVIAGGLKLGKLTLYGVAGVLAARALTDETRRKQFSWALLVSGLVVAASLFWIQDPNDAMRPERANAGYKAMNAVSVMMAVLLCYLGGLWVCGLGTRKWRALAGPGLLLMTLGFLLSHGRGGWIAALAGVAYFFYRRGFGTRLVVGLAGAAILIVAAYNTFPEFSNEVDRTIWPDEEYLNRYASGVGGFDDGARLQTWTHELGIFARSPLLGTGFFHRGGTSGLWLTGSHNFFIQMFLETGIVGGLLVFETLRRMWRLAGSAPARAINQDVPARSALVAAFVGGLTGEYYYGGMVLFTLLLIFAPVGGLAMPASPRHIDFHDPLVVDGWEP